MDEKTDKMTLQSRYDVLRRVFLARENCLTWGERMSNARLFDRELEAYVQLRIKRALLEEGFAHG